MSGWADTPYVFVERVTCPYCGRPRPITIRSERSADGSICRKSVCRFCSQRFRVILELPDEDEFELPANGKVDLAER
jgi:hypothetical protein